MPVQDLRNRGGVVKWRTKKLPDGTLLRVAIVKKAGPRGGHTVAESIRRSAAPKARPKAKVKIRRRRK